MKSEILWKEVMPILVECAQIRSVFLGRSGKKPDAYSHFSIKSMNYVNYNVFCRIQIRPDISRAGQAGPNGLIQGSTGVISSKVESNQSHPEGLRQNQFQNKVKRTHLRVGFRSAHP